MLSDEQLGAALRDLAEFGFVHVDNEKYAEQVRDAAKEAGQVCTATRLGGSDRTPESWEVRICRQRSSTQAHTGHSEQRSIT